MGELLKHGEEPLNHVHLDSRITTLKSFNSRLLMLLKRRNVPLQIVKHLESLQKRVIDKATEMTINEDSIPFLPVIPITCLPLCEQLKLVRNKNNICYSRYIELPLIVDKTKQSEKPYYIFDIDVGMAPLEQSALGQTRKLITKAPRLPLNITEVISLCIHTDLFLQHNVSAVGSYYGCCYKIPYIGMPTGIKHPELCWVYSETSNGSRFLLPSCIYKLDSDHI